MQLLHPAPSSKRTSVNSYPCGNPAVFNNVHSSSPHSIGSQPQTSITLPLKKRAQPAEEEGLVFVDEAPKRTKITSHEKRRYEESERQRQLMVFFLFPLLFTALCGVRKTAHCLQYEEAC